MAGWHQTFQVCAHSTERRRACLSERNFERGPSSKELTRGTENPTTFP